MGVLVRFVAAQIVPSIVFLIHCQLVNIMTECDTSKYQHDPGRDATDDGQHHGGNDRATVLLLGRDDGERPRQGKLGRG